MISNTWVKIVPCYTAGIQRGPLAERTLIEKMTAHNERVKQLIPPDKLLIYQQGDGWDGLVEWLEVYVNANFLQLRY